MDEPKGRECAGEDVRGRHLGLQLQQRPPPAAALLCAAGPADSLSHRPRSPSRARLRRPRNPPAPPPAGGRGRGGLDRPTGVPPTQA